MRVRFTPFDKSGAFSNAVGGVERRAIRGAGVTVISSGLGLAIQIVATMVLARLLRPSDFGLLTMVTTFSLLLTNFGMNGFTEAILQRPEMDHTLASAIFWVTVSGGMFLTLGFAAGASLLARFFHNSLVAPVAVGMSITILITCSSVVHLALLKRAMLFSPLFAIDTFSRVASLSVSILLAWAGWGYWALVTGAVVLAMTQSIGAWVLCRWIPGRPRGAPGLASVMHFAMNVYARFASNYFGRNTDNLLVAWRFGPQTLGFYKKAYDLFALSAYQLTAPLTNVAVAGLSRLGPTSIRYKQLLTSALAVTAFVGMGLGADLTLIGKDVIRVLLGSQWAPAGRMFTFFGPGIGVMFLYYTHSWIHLSVGTADRWFRWGIVEYVFTALLFVLGLHWGPEGVAAAWTVSYWILTIPALWYAGVPIQFGITPIVGAVWKYALASLMAGSASAALIRIVPFLAATPGPQAALVRIVLISFVFLPLYLSAVILLYRSFEPLRLVGRLLREMAPQGTLPAQFAVAATGVEE